MKLRFAGLFALLLLIVSACSRQPESFGAWIRSPKALARMQELATKPPEQVSLRRQELIARIVGTGKVFPLVALEDYFRSIPSEKILGSEAEYAESAHYFLDSVTSGKKFKKDFSYFRTLNVLWELQVFRSLPLDKRTKLLNRPLFAEYADSSNEGRLLPFEANRNPKTAEQFSNELSFTFPPTSKTMRRFGDSLDLLRLRD